MSKNAARLKHVSRKTTERVTKIVIMNMVLICEKKLEHNNNVYCWFIDGIKMLTVSTSKASRSECSL